MQTLHYARRNAARLSLNLTILSDEMLTFNPLAHVKDDHHQDLHQLNEHCSLYNIAELHI